MVPTSLKNKYLMNIGCNIEKDKPRVFLSLALIIFPRILHYKIYGTLIGIKDIKENGKMNVNRYDFIHAVLCIPFGT